MVCFLGGYQLSVSTLLLAPSEFEMGGGYAAPCLASVGDEGVAWSLVSTPFHKVVQRTGLLLHSPVYCTTWLRGVDLFRSGMAGVEVLALRPKIFSLQAKSLWGTLLIRILPVMEAIPISKSARMGISGRC